MTELFGITIDLPVEVLIIGALFRGLVLGAGGVALGKRR